MQPLLLKNRERVAPLDVHESRGSGHHPDRADGLRTRKPADRAEPERDGSANQDPNANG